MKKQFFAAILFAVFAAVFFKVYRYYGFGYAASVLSGICLAIVTYISISIKGIGGIVVRFFYTLLAALQIISKIYTNNYISPGVAASFFETDSAEAFGVLLDTFFIPIGIIVILFCILQITSKLVDSIQISYKVVLLFVMLNLVPVGAHAIRWRLWEESPGQMGLVSSRFDFTCKLLHANPFASPACLTGSYFYEKGKLNSYGTQKRQLPEGVNLVDNDLSGTKLKVVFIIGESGARNHYKTYGYQHGTDYFLSQVSGDGAFIVPHAIASSPITREALPRALSFASPISFDAFHDHKNIAELAKDAGFKTTWISNQRQVGYHDSSVGAIASSCAKTIFIQKGLKGYSSRLDQELINPFIDEILADYKKQFIFMHLAGSHRPYSDKYNEIDWLAAEKSSENLRPYDASVHQTDSVIKAIFEEMPKTDNWLIVYMPDHGENPLSSLGHGYSPLDRQELDIPLVALGSPAVVKTFKKSIARFSRVDGIFNTSNMIYVLGELLGYRYSAGIVESALVEADYVFHTDEKIYPINDLK